MKPRASGFTLIEVLIALAVTALVMVMLGQALQTGSRALAVWTYGMRTQFDFDPVEHALRGMIERMDPGVFPDPPLFRGTARTLVFTTELPDPTTGRLRVADVRLDVTDGDLLLQWTVHGRGVPFAAPMPPERIILLTHIARLELSYAARWSGVAWRDVWIGDGLPGLVRLRIVPAPGGVAQPSIVVRPLRERIEE